MLCLILTCMHARQRGTEDVMNFLAKEATYGKVDSILFLMPCHATPFYSTLHHNLPMRFLDCSPRWWLKFRIVILKLICFWNHIHVQNNKVLLSVNHVGRLPLVRRDGPICEVLKLPMKLWTLNSQLYNQWESMCYKPLNFTSAPCFVRCISHIVSLPFGHFLQWWQRSFGWIRPFHDGPSWFRI